MKPVAVIGAGGWGRNVVETFDALGALEAVAELDPARRAELADRYPGVGLYSELETLWRSPVPAVAVATPAPTHFAIAKAALLAGKHVFVEKPLTLDAGEAEELVQLAGSVDRVLMVGHLLLYQPAIQWIKGFLKAGGLGQVHRLHQERLNLGRARSVENVLWSFGAHDLAVLMFLIGAEPTGMRVSGQRILQPQVEDDVRLDMVFPEAVEAHLHVSWLWPEKRRRLTIIGEAGMLVYDELDQTVMVHRKGISSELATWDQGVEQVYSGGAEPLKLELAHFLSCIRGEEPPVASGACGLAVVRLLEQATHLLEERQDVLLRA